MGYLIVLKGLLELVAMVIIRRMVDSMKIATCRTMSKPVRRTDSIISSTDSTKSATADVTAILMNEKL